MAPQHDTFKRGIWARLETKVRQWAKVADGVYVVSGAVFDKDENGQRDADADADLMSPTNRVAIRVHSTRLFFTLTGIDFFAELPDQ